MSGSAASADLIPGIATGRAEPESDGIEACWRRSLETAGNLLCRLCSDEASTVRVVLPLGGQAANARRLEALARRLADERELSFQAKHGSHSITITFSNRV